MSTPSQEIQGTPAQQQQFRDQVKAAIDFAATHQLNAAQMAEVNRLRVLAGLQDYNPYSTGAVPQQSITESQQTYLASLQEKVGASAVLSFGAQLDPSGQREVLIKEATSSSLYPRVWGQIGGNPIVPMGNGIPYFPVQPGYNPAAGDYIKAFDSKTGKGTVGNIYREKAVEENKMFWQLQGYPELSGYDVPTLAAGEYVKGARVNEAGLTVEFGNYESDKAQQVSKDFFEKIGFPQYGGKYAPFDPEGRSIANIEENEGKLTVFFTNESNAPSPQMEGFTPPSNHFDGSGVSQAQINEIVHGFNVLPVATKISLLKTRMPDVLKDIPKGVELTDITFKDNIFSFAYKPSQTQIIMKEREFNALGLSTKISELKRLSPESLKGIALEGISDITFSGKTSELTFLTALAPLTAPVTKDRFNALTADWLPSGPSTQDLGVPLGATVTELVKTKTGFDIKYELPEVKQAPDNFGFPSIIKGPSTFSSLGLIKPVVNAETSKFIRTVGATIALAPIVGPASALLGVGISVGVSLVQKRELLTLQEYADQAFLGAAFVGIGKPISLLTGVGSGATKVITGIAGRSAVFTGVGAGTGYVLSGGDVGATLESAKFALAFSLLSEGAGFMNTKFRVTERIKEGGSKFTKFTGQKETTLNTKTTETPQTIPKLNIKESNSYIDDYLNANKNSKVISDTTAKLENLSGQTTERINSRISEVIAQKNGFPVDIEAKINAVLKERTIFLEQEKIAVTPSKFMEGISDNALPSNVKSDYLIKQPEQTNLDLSKQIQISGRNTVDISGASAKIDKMLNDIPSKFSYGDYKSTMAQGKTVVSTKPAVTIEKMLKLTVPKSVQSVSTGLASTEFITGITNVFPYSVKPTDYLIKQPEQSNLDISKQIKISGRNTVNVADASAQIDRMINEVPSKISYGDYKSTIGEGKTLVQTKTSMVSIVNPKQLNAIEKMLKVTVPKPVLPTSTREKVVVVSSGIRLTPLAKESNVENLASEKLSSLLSGNISANMMNVINQRTSQESVNSISQKIGLAIGVGEGTAAKMVTTPTISPRTTITPKIKITTTPATAIGTIMGQAQIQTQGQTQTQALDISQLQIQTIGLQQKTATRNLLKLGLKESMDDKRKKGLKGLWFERTHPVKTSAAMLKTFGISNANKPQRKTVTVNNAALFKQFNLGSGRKPKGKTGTVNIQAIQKSFGLTPKKKHKR